MRTQKGQILIGAIILLVILAILVPALILYVQNESKWTVKEQRTTRAFQLAESGVERGFQQVIQSTTVWSNLQAGGFITGYHFDQAYTDPNGGQYEINITSGSGAQSCIITSVGRDSGTKEVRAVRTMYGNSASNAAIFAQGGITLTNNPSVEWGPVFSPNVITTSHTHPRFYSAGNIVGLDPNGPTPPNSDNTQWWSYDANLPPPPQIDLQSYLSSATAQGHVFAGGNVSNGNMTGTYYYTGDTTFKPHNFLVGNLIVMGDFTLQGNAANGNYTTTIPVNAWKEYGKDWASGWKGTYDAGAGAWPGQNGTYTTSSTLPLSCTLDKVVVHGFMYVNGSFNITGGGNCCVHGSLYIGNSSSLDGSHVKVYYDATTTMLTKNVSLSRSSWQEVLACRWTGANPVCAN